MGLVDEAMGARGGGPGGAAGGVDAVGLAAAVAALLGREPAGALRGLGGLEAAFERGGLGHAFRSWVGAGPNLSVTSGELEGILGADAVGRLAKSLGADPARVTAGLAEVLPRVVDQLTPAGMLPDGGGNPLALAHRLIGR